MNLESLLSLFSAIQSASKAYASQSEQSSALDGWSLEDRNPVVLGQQLPLIQWLYDHYFHVTTDGWEQTPTDEPVMFVGSHNGGIAAPDMHMMLCDWCRRFGTEQPLYGLMSPKVWDAFPSVARLATQMGAVQAHPKMAIAALNKGANIVVYPGGIQDVFRPHSKRHKIHFYQRKGFIKLAIKKGVPIVPMISHGAHSSFIVLADIYPLMKALHDWGMPWALGIDPEAFPLYLGLPWGFSFGPLPHIPLPVQIHTRICSPIRFDRVGSKALHDSNYIGECYERVHTQMQRALDQLVRERGYEKLW
ncbi:MAG: lysophospholipid acyltransferase family protein [Cyanobacteria bacterium P01_D01_bin.1]